jgi:hypothetical protein
MRWHQITEGRVVTEAQVGTPISIDLVPRSVKEDIITLMLSNCPRFEDYWMKEHGIMSFNETYVAQFFFGTEDLDDDSLDDMTFTVTPLVLNPNEINNTNRSVSDNVVAKYAALSTPPPPILVIREGQGWKIIEGGHRIAAAKLRGSETIRAYDVTDLCNMDFEGL